jgi:hypothetical protein
VNVLRASVFDSSRQSQEQQQRLITDYPDYPEKPGSLREPTSGVGAELNHLLVPYHAGLHGVEKLFFLLRACQLVIEARPFQGQHQRAFWSLSNSGVSDEHRHSPRSPKSKQEERRPFSEQIRVRPGDPGNP